MTAHAPSSADSEVGTLRTVLLHRPGAELQRLTPGNNDRLLFDGIPWVERAQLEHDRFAATLARHGVRVLLLADVLRTALDDPETCTRGIDDAVDERVLGREVTSLELVDPRFYHLDTALTVLGDDDVAYFPGAFAEAAQATLREVFPDALTTDAATAEVLGMNAVSDGRHVVLSPLAHRYADLLRGRGYDPVPVDLSELLKGGGGAKCCTLEVRR